MYNVSAKGNWTEWIEFFLSIVVESAKLTIGTIDKLLSLQEEFRAVATGAMRSANALNLVDHIFERPVISVPQAAEFLNISYRPAKNIIEKLTENGIFYPIVDTHPQLWYSPRIFSVAQS